MDYKILVDGADVTDRISIVDDVLFVSDRAGAQADSIKLLMNNASDFQIAKGQKIAVEFNGYSSGKMTIDKIEPATTNTIVEAVSTSSKAKKRRTRHYRKVRFFEVINDVATETGFSVFYMGTISNRYYENISRYEETPLAFLNRLCVREGYALKVDNDRIIVYDKGTAERAKEVFTITQESTINNVVKFRDTALVTEAVKVRYFDLQTGNTIEYTAGIEEAGEETVITEYLFDLAEAERFAKGYLREKNKNIITAVALIPINTDIAATNNIAFSDFGRYDGKYHIEEITHCPIAEQTKIIARKIL